MFTVTVFRGIDCGFTNLSEKELADELMKASKKKFHKRKYNIFTNNCRNFCDFLIFDVLKPSKKENGKLIQDDIFFFVPGYFKK